MHLPVCQSSPDARSRARRDERIEDVHIQADPKISNARALEIARSVLHHRFQTEVVNFVHRDGAADVGLDDPLSFAWIQISQTQPNDLLVLQVVPRNDLLLNLLPSGASRMVALARQPKKRSHRHAV